MAEPDPTRIGSVRHVLGSQITVALDDDLAGVAPIYRGQIQSVGQIGSIVRIPQGSIDLIGQVSLLGIAELSGPQEPAEIVVSGDRWLRVQLLGEIDRTSRRFGRGVGTYPGLDDPVHFATLADLDVIYPNDGNNRLRIGRLAVAEELPVALDTVRFVLRHSAIVGSTGSGKTSTVARILQQLARAGWGASNVVLVDPHGEYAAALKEDAAIRSVLGGNERRLQVPYWALSAESILHAFVGNTGGPSTLRRFQELVAEARREYASKADWLQIAATAITSDTPVPFEIRQVWHKLDSENCETRMVKGDPSTVCVEIEGDPDSLTPTQYTPYSQGGAAPFQGPSFGVHGRVPELLRLGLSDPLLAFLHEPLPNDTALDPLVTTLVAWLGGKHAVSVLDFSGVPARASELAIGVVLSLLFEAAVRSDPHAGGIGRPRPVLIVLEEAHRYLGEDASPMARDAVNRIAREGRKYGVGLMLVTQRPSELPDTALAQCGTLVALRLTNSADQSKIEAALPDSVSGLARVLPSLRTGEAVVTGEALVIPSRTLIDMPDPWPSSDDPVLDSWQTTATEPDVTLALARWRHTYSGGS